MGQEEWDTYNDPREKARRKAERQRASMPVEERRMQVTFILAMIGILLSSLLTTFCHIGSPGIGCRDAFTDVYFIEVHKDEPSTAACG